MLRHKLRIAYGALHVKPPDIPFEFRLTSSTRRCIQDYRLFHTLPQHVPLRSYRLSSHESQRAIGQEATKIALAAAKSGHFIEIYVRLRFSLGCSRSYPGSIQQWRPKLVTVSPYWARALSLTLRLRRLRTSDVYGISSDRAGTK